MNTGEWMPMKEPPIPSESKSRPDWGIALDGLIPPRPPRKRRHHPPQKTVKKKENARIEQPEFWPVDDWTESIAYQISLAENIRMAAVESLREAQLIREADHEAQLRFLKRQAALLARIPKPDPDPTV
jgi:hypothetical protein